MPRGFKVELLRVFSVEPLPAAELHGIGADDAADGLSGEQTIQHVEADVPAGSTHRDEATVDVVPEREPSAAASQRLQFPAELRMARRCGSAMTANADSTKRIFLYAYMRVKRCCGREACGHRLCVL